MKIGVTVAHARVHYGDTPSLEGYNKYVKWAKDFGFEGFELAAFTREHFYSQFGDVRKIRTLKEYYKSLGLECNAFEAGFCRFMMVDPSKKVREKVVQDFGEVVRVSSELDSSLIYAHSAPHPSWKIEWRRLYDEYTPPSKVFVPADFSWEIAWEQYVEMIDKLTDIVEDTGILFALEIRPYEIVSGSDCMLRLIEAVGSKSLGVVFDTGHFFVQKEILPIAIEKLKGKIFLVHLCDNDGCTDYHWAPGKGEIDWENTLKALKKIDYNGYANIDVAGKYEDIDREILDGKNYVIKLMEK